jgi:rod shape determining protein RodA
VIIIVTLAHFLAQRYERMDSLGPLIGSAIHVAIPTALIFVQPDLGTAIVFLVIWFTLIWAAGLRLKHIMLFGLAGLMALPLVWSQMAPYQRDRITTFLSTDDEGLQTYGTRFNIRQAEITIGSGGFVGKGYANGSQTQLRFLRVRHTDFIFSVICEELGFLGAGLILLIFILLLWRLLRIAGNAEDATGRLIVIGVTMYIFYQLLVNLGMNLNVIPVAGLPMPFISSGGSALVVTFFGLGLVESVAMHQRRLEF